jgi:hypothetical protein
VLLPAFASRAELESGTLSDFGQRASGHHVGTRRSASRRRLQARSFAGRCWRVRRLR